MNINIIGPMTVNEKLISKEDIAIIVDGGSSNIKNIENYASYLHVGDMDSSDKILENAIKINKDKDYSDLAFSLCFAGAYKELQVINMYGFVGGRQDHFQAILKEIENLLCIFTNVRVNLWNNKEISMAYLPMGEHTLNHHGSFSVFTEKDAIIQITGNALYQKKDNSDLSNSRGISNYASGSIMIRNTKTTLIYLAID